MLETPHAITTTPRCRPSPLRLALAAITALTASAFASGADRSPTVAPERGASRLSATFGDQSATSPLGSVAGATACATAQWIPSFGDWPGVSIGAFTSGTVRASAMFDDGSGGGPRLYIGGDFTIAGGQVVTNIAQWDGARWAPVGDPNIGPAGTVNALVVHDDGSGPALYVGGSFAAFGGLASPRLVRWNGATWSGVGSGTSGTVRALCVFDDGLGDGPALFVGGSFTSAGGVAANRVARWNGANWSALAGGLSGQCFALTVFDGGQGGGPALYAGGQFTTAGGVTVNRVAKWNGAAWSALGSGVAGPTTTVFALGVHPDGVDGADRLFIGGLFSTVGGVAVSNIAAWDGSSWSALGAGADSFVLALCSHDDGSGLGRPLFVGGSFNFVDGMLAQKIATWDGTAWSALPAELSASAIRTMVAPNDGSHGVTSLYLGGDVSNFGGYIAANIVRWDGRGWHALGDGLNDAVFATTIFDHGLGDGPQLHVGGSFRWGDGNRLDRVARWDGTSWQPVGQGFNGPVRALHVHDDGLGGGPTLYAGGSFNLSGEAQTNFVARWSGTEWVPLDTGTDGAVFAFATYDDRSGTGPALFAGGRFVTAGGIVSNNIARWDGVAWSALAGGVRQGGNLADVHAMAVYDDGFSDEPSLFVAGAFWTAGEITVNSIARWNGSEWSAVGGGLSTGANARSALVFDDGAGPALYLGGNMNAAAGMPVTRVVRWDGVAWSSVGLGIISTPRGGIVYALAAHDDGLGGGPTLYAAGEFLFASGVPVKRLIRWSGSVWEPVEPGLDATARTALSFDLGDGPLLVIGGEFRASPSGDSYLVALRPCIPPTSSAADLNGDGVVNAADLGVLLAAWGLCLADETCFGDLNGDGIVDAVDLGLLLTAWTA